MREYLPSLERNTDASPDRRRLFDLVDVMRHTSCPATRAHLAAQLRAAVDDITDIGETKVRPFFEIDHANERGPAVADLVDRLHCLLTSVSLNDRLAAIAAFTALITTTESMHARTQRTSNAIRVLFNTNLTDIATASAAARLVATFSRVDSPMSVRAVEYALNNAISLIGSPTDEPPNNPLSVDRARAAMVITSLAREKRVSSVIFCRQAPKLCRDMWRVCWDPKARIRECGVRALQAVLEITVTRAEKVVVSRTVRDVVETIRRTLSPHTAPALATSSSSPKANKGVPVVHGSMAVLGTLLFSDKTVSFMHPYAAELCNLVLRYQTCKEPLLRQALAWLLPALVRLDGDLFANRFLNSVHTSTLGLIENPRFPGEERGRSLVALAEIAKQMPPDSSTTLIPDMLRVCREALRLSDAFHDYHLIPEHDVILAISQLAKAERCGPFFEKAVREGLLTQMFNTNFTNSLVMAVDNIGNVVPTFAEPIRLRLVHLIAATLKKRMKGRSDGFSPTQSKDSSVADRRPKLGARNGVVPRTQSLMSLEVSPRQTDTRMKSASMQPGLQKAGKGDKDISASPQAKSRDYFRPSPIIDELYRIDSSPDLASRPEVKAFNALLKEDLMERSFSGRTENTFMPPEPSQDVEIDQNNSPCVALKAIVNYDFSDMQVQDFISFATEFVIGYVEQNSVKVRVLAVAACAKLMLSAAELWAGPTSARRLPKQLRRGIHLILEQLLSIAVADPSIDVRYVAIRSLDQQIFYPYLLQPEMLEKLFLCCLDESLAMRDTALAIAGRLSQRNPAHVLPSLRNQLVHFMTVLKCDGECFATERRRATELLYTLVHNAPGLTVPYTTTLMEALLLRLQEAHRFSDPGMALPLLKSVAELGGTMGRIDLRPFTKDFIPLLVNSVLHVRSAGSRYKIAAFRALAAFVQNTAQAIKPYIEHPQLLPELIQSLQGEADEEVRLHAEILLGSLGAVDPDEHKHVAIINYRAKESSVDRMPGGASQGHSTYRQSASAPHILLPWNTAGYTLRTVGAEGKGPLTEQEHKIQERYGIQDKKTNRLAMKTGTYQGGPKKPARNLKEDQIDIETYEEELTVSLALFELGSTKLMKKIAGYSPPWAEPEMIKDSLIGRLEHPFTASPDYFPSAALEGLHKIIGNPRLRDQHREACQAIVYILKSVGPKCANFLPSVVPRIEWLLAQSLAKDSRKGTRFGQLEQHLMQRLADIVATAGHMYRPFTFDTVLLVLAFFNSAKQSAGCVTSACTLLSRLSGAIDAEFKPVIATVLPFLLNAMVQDRSANGAISTAVLRTLESFGNLLGNYHSIVLVTLMEVVSTRACFTIKAAALTTLIRIVSCYKYVEVFSCVMHPLMKILAGARDRTYDRPSLSQHSNDLASHNSNTEWADDELADLAASALTEIGVRASKRFDVFVPVVAKALRASNVQRSKEMVYRALKACLMRRDPDIVRELLEEEQGTTFRSMPVLHEGGMDGSGMSSFDSVRSKLAPTVRGRALQGQPSLPEGTKTHQIGAHVVEPELVAKWEVNHNCTAQDWMNWFSSVGAVMFEQSGSPAFRACGRVSDSYPDFIRELFNAAFLSCWTTNLSHQTKSRICDALETAMSSDTIPVTILQAILFLFEYMDHAERPLPAATAKLARTACKCGAFAKAVRYREQDYVQHFDSKDQMKEDVIGEDGLMEIYEKLGQTESAVGTVIHYQKTSGEEASEEWYEKLQQWDDALKSYRKTIRFHSGNEEERESSAPPLTSVVYSDRRSWKALLGALRCLNEIGEWREMNTLLQEARQACHGNMNALRQLALQGKGASVTFDLGLWDEFEQCVDVLETDTYDGCFYHTLLSIELGKEQPIYLDKAEKFLHQARRKLDLELTARVSEAYPRAYVHVVNAQLLVEMEEIIQFLRLSRKDAIAFGKGRLDDVWTERLKGCKHDMFSWYRLLMIRALVQRPVDVKEHWLDFTNICWKNKRLPWASEALRKLVSSCSEQSQGDNAYTSQHPVSANNVPLVGEWNTNFLLSIREVEVRFACIKHLWNVGRRVEAFKTLDACRDDFAFSRLEPRVRFENSHSEEVRHIGNNGQAVLTSDVFLRLAEWGETIICDGLEANISDDLPLTYADRAVRIRPDWAEAWHYWGNLNANRFKALVKGNKSKRSSLDQTRNPRWDTPSNTPELAQGHLGRRYFDQAVKALFTAIDLDTSMSTLEDSLKVLTLWFNYGGFAGVHAIFDKCFEHTNIIMWLAVVPQIIARLYSPFQQVQAGVKKLLTKIGKQHPQIAVYPLTVAKGAIGEGLLKRRKAADEILAELKVHHRELVEQSDLVSTELVRAAIVWAELWFEKLEEASKLYFVEHNTGEMLDILLRLHEEIERGAKTEYEENFINEFGKTLKDAANLIRRVEIGYRSVDPVQKESTRNYMIAAWQHYHEVFGKLQKVQNSMMLMDLEKVSRRLHEASDLVLAIPGTYDPNNKEEVIGIRKFGAHLYVLQSKQRPRKLSMLGSDGREYDFLLKGHEDLRQDERVMQVFRLINKIFAKSTHRVVLTGVEMKTYTVVSLSSNVGLIEWVPECDTMHALVKEYREVRKIMPNVEHKVMLRLAAEPDRLPLLHKVDLFEAMLQQTGSVDIAKVLWLQSRNSEIWLETRNTYAKSLATTSMTGYLLGLGDRHPSNLMIERSTGRVMHIDFGDCFEVAMSRDKFPETVPFRLTRMLVHALEPCGVDGFFRHTAEATMEVLRQRDPRESLMSLMEAFVYDPLLRWKLIGPEELDQIRKESRNARAEANATNGMAPDTLQPSRQDTEESEEMPEIKSLEATGCLSRSVRSMQQSEREVEAGPRAADVASETAPGAITFAVTNANSTAVNKDDFDIDPANMQTPSEEARMRQMRAVRNGDQFHDEKIIGISKEKARCALERFESKLYGTDFERNVELSVAEQVNRLIEDAQSIENLCALFMGWCAFW